MQIVIDIDENEYIGIKSFPNGNTSYPWTLHLYDAVRNGTPIPDNATNGDIIKAMFPNTSIHYHKANELVDDYVSVNIMGCDTQQDYSAEWWNAPCNRLEYGIDGNVYKMTISNGKEFEQGPCDDAISREDATAEFIKWQNEVVYAFGRDYLGVRIIQSAIDTIRQLPSVQPICEEREKGECPWYAG